MKTENKIIDLHPTEESLCNKDVIESLERALEEAKKDNVVNCSIILLHKDSSITYSYSNHYLRFTMVGALEYLKSLIIGVQQ